MAIGAEKRKTPETEVPSVDVELAKRAAAALAGPKHDAQGAGGLLPNHEFELDYTDTRGYRWHGTFKAHVLTPRERIQVGLIRAKLANHTPPDALDLQTAELLEIAAHLAVAIDDGPDWGRDVLNLHTAGVGYAIYEEVASYEARFHGTAGGSAGKGADADGGGTSAPSVAPEDGGAAS